MLILRPARMGDLPEVERLAADSPIGVTSLPDDRERLAEKIRRERGRVVWRVDYREYREGAEGLEPSGLVIVNRRYGYRLVVSAREMER